jgi:hypothetical protein
MPKPIDFDRLVRYLADRVAGSAGSLG